MATGLEIAGVVLGSLPLIIAALEHYAQGVAAAKRFLRYRLEMKSILTELTTQKSIFINTCEILLTGMVPVQEMSAFLREPGEELWKDTLLDQKLRERLGTSYDGYIETIKGMDAAAEEFKKRLKLDSAGKVSSPVLAILLADVTAS